jgi:formylglycine-generating enzyme required for sulfatase activity
VTSEQWIEVPGGQFLVGLTDEEARRLAHLAADRARAAAAHDPDLLHGDREARELEELWGNPERLIELLAFARPAHPIELAPFAITAQPVSVRDWEEFRRATRAVAPAGGGVGQRGPADPITGISWAEASAYAAWRGATLPGEAQWERAARGVERRLFAWGADPEAPALYEWTADEFGPYPGADGKACARIPPPEGGWWGTRTRRGGPLPGFPATAVTRRGADPEQRLRDTTFRLARPA